jgi:hypothetical protein
VGHGVEREARQRDLPVGTSQGGGRRLTRYRFVDFAAARQVGFRNHVVALPQVAPLVALHGADECYASIFCFSDEVFLYLVEHRVDGRPSIAGYDGRVWAPFLPFDIDAHPPDASLEDALAVARRTDRLLTDRWQVPANVIHRYFSGAKGFHLLIDMRACGRVAASGALHRVLSRMRLEIVRALPDAVRPLFDLAIGDKVRLLRLPNTRHAGSGLYKVALTQAELLEASVVDIRALARAPRPLSRAACAGLLPVEPVATHPRLVELYQHARRVLRRQRAPHPYRLGPAPAEAHEALCPARRRMWEASIRPGNRNNVAIRLASALRLAGFGEAATLAWLADWNHRQPVALSDRELRGVVRSAFARPYPYTFGCHDEVIRSFCPYVGRLTECEDYRTHHPRAHLV